MLCLRKLAVTEYGMQKAARVDVEKIRTVPLEHSSTLTLAHVKRYVILRLTDNFSFEAAFVVQCLVSIQCGQQAEAIIQIK